MNRKENIYLTRAAILKKLLLKQLKDTENK